VHPAGSVADVAALTALMVIASTALAFSLSIAALQHISPTESAVTSTLEPAVAGLTALGFLGTQLLPLQYLGGSLPPQPSCCSRRRIVEHGRHQEARPEPGSSHPALAALALGDEAFKHGDCLGKVVLFEHPMFLQVGTMWNHGNARIGYALRGWRKESADIQADVLVECDNPKRPVNGAGMWRQ
jgi:hypothetical protein